ncbi:MAG: exopolysaccharide biosynthesis polyprenyl glycosylphosphotransferase [Erysipelotrichaceae bacterium]
MKRKILGAICFLIQYAVIVFTCIILEYSGEYTFRFILLYFILQFVFGCYSGKTTLIWEEFRLQFTSHFAFFLASLTLTPIIFVTNWHIIANALFAVCMLFFNLIIAKFVRYLLLDMLTDRVLIIGAGLNALALDEICATNRFALMDIKGYVDINDTYPKLKQKIRVIDKNRIFQLCDLHHLLDSFKIDQVVVAVPEISRHDLDEIMSILRGKVNQIKYIPSSSGLVTFDSNIEDLDGQIVISSTKGSGPTYMKFMKRFLDILGGIAGLILLAPLSLYVKYKNNKSGDQAPIFFTQDRVGKNGKVIKIYKYRTMVPNAEVVLEEMMEENPEVKEEYLKNKKLENDPRITKAGNMLRRTSLDEIPQLINVLKGEMSLVGPRPYLLREKDDMGTYYKTVIGFKPGITGMWQTHGRSDVSFDDRLKMDDYYFGNWSFWLDITILIKTFKTVISHDGAK